MVIPLLIALLVSAPDCVVATIDTRVVRTDGRSRYGASQIPTDTLVGQWTLDESFPRPHYFLVDGPPVGRHRTRVAWRGRWHNADITVQDDGLARVSILASHYPR